MHVTAPYWDAIVWWLRSPLWKNELHF